MIVKTFGLSKFVYTSSMIGMPNRIQKEVNDIIYQFIWNDPDKIKRSVSCRKFNEGRLNMFDLKAIARVKTQSVMWLKRLAVPNEAGWKYVTRYSKRYLTALPTSYRFDMNRGPIIKS